MCPHLPLEAATPTDTTFMITREALSFSSGFRSGPVGFGTMPGQNLSKIIIAIKDFPRKNNPKGSFCWLYPTIVVLTEKTLKTLKTPKNLNRVILRGQNAADVQNELFVGKIGAF